MATLVLLMLAATATRFAALLVPITVRVATLVIAFRQARQRETLPQTLAEEASTEPPPQCSGISEPGVITAIRAVTGGRARVLDRARAMVVARGNVPRADRALARLDAARRSTVRARVATLTRSGLAWAIAATAMIASSELVV